MRQNRESEAFDDGEGEAHDGAAAVGTRDGNRAVVGARDLVDDRETETGPGHRARGGGAVEAFEDVREIVVVDPRSVIAHGERAVGEGHFDRAGGRAPLARVVEDVRARTL